MSETSKIREWYLSLFKDFEQRLNGEKSRPVHKLRRDAIEKFAGLDFPDLHNEEWRFTDISPILRHTFSYAAPLTDGALPRDVLVPFLFRGMKSHRLVFVNGSFLAGLSSVSALPKGVFVGSLAEAIKTDDGRITGHIAKSLEVEADAFTALNTAFTLDGACVIIPDGVVLEEPVHLLFVASGENATISQPRNLVITGSNSQASLIEHYVAARTGAYFTNTVTGIEAGRNSAAAVVKIQSEGEEAYHVSTTAATVDADASYQSLAVSIGSKIYRHTIGVVLKGEGGNTDLEGLYLTRDDQLSDTHSTIDHAAPHCTSGEHYKGILDGKSRAVFNGKIVVRKGAQKTNSYQENRNIILSNEAKVDTKPQLEIFADDVKCSHGATVGQLSKESLFYLMSRGIGEEQARMILIYAFASDVLKNVKQENVRAELEEILSSRFLRGM